MQNPWKTQREGTPPPMIRKSCECYGPGALTGRIFSQLQALRGHDK